MTKLFHAEKTKQKKHIYFIILMQIFLLSYKGISYTHYSLKSCYQKKYVSINTDGYQTNGNNHGKKADIVLRKSDLSI